MTNRDYSGPAIDATIQHIGDSEPMQTRRDANGETVEATTDDDLHAMTTEHIPEEVNLDELSGKKREIVETAAKNPTLTASGVDERVGTSQYASKVLREECPNWYNSTFKSATPSDKATGPGYSDAEAESDATGEEVSQDRMEFVQESETAEEPDSTAWEQLGENVTVKDSLTQQRKLKRIRETCETVAHMDTPVGEFAEALLTEVLEDG